jgi:PAS domain S-box-containing protein
VIFVDNAPLSHDQATWSGNGILAAVRSPSRVSAVRRRIAHLDRSATAAAERTVRLAARVLGARVAFLALVDEDRHHLLGGFGLSDPLNGGEPRCPSRWICPMVVARRSPIAIADARVVPGLASLPSTKSDVVAYLGVPLRCEGGEVVGALCVADAVPRRWSEEEVGILGDLAESAALTIDLVVAARESDRRARHARRATEEADAMHRRYRDFVEGLDAIVWEADADRFGCSYLNGPVEELLGYPAEGLIGDPDPWRSLIHPEDYDRVVAERRSIATEGKAREIEFRVVAADGRVFWFRDRVRLVTGSGGRPRLLRGLMVDVTERKGLEELLRQSQKLESVGRLAGGIAHDFNNLITAINGYCQFLLESVAPHDERRADLEEIRKAADRAASLARQLLAFSRKQDVALAEICPNDVISELEKLLCRVIGEDITLTTVLDVSLGTVKADPAQLEQVLMNLVVNARDAMPDGGSIAITTHNVRLDTEIEFGRGRIGPGDFVAVRVTDTGCGMDSDTLSRIFDPFFTTKPPGKGTGLGLATVDRIVRELDGVVHVTSAPGQGTTFEILLPRVREGAPRIEKDTPVPAASGNGSETILVVEDDDVVRNLVVRILGGAGYSVLEARNGAEAILLCERHEGRIDLLLSDLVMPRMGGRDLVDRLAPLRPGLRVLIMSGHSEDHPVDRAGMGPGVAFIEKPFHPAALVRRVRAILDGPVTDVGSVAHRSRSAG